MSNQHKRERLPMFNNLWEFTLKITHIFGKDLGFEFEFAQIGYFVVLTGLLGGLFLLLEKVKLMTLFSQLPVVGLLFSDVAFFVGYPLGLSFYLNKLKLDGKAPYRYIYDYIEYLFEPGLYQNWEPIQTEDVHIIVKVYFRITKYIDLFEDPDKKEKIRLRYDYD